MSYVRGVDLMSLGMGGGFALWSFRAIASGCRGCNALFRGLENAFGEDAGDALEDITAFARVLGRRGARRILLASAGCCGITADELSVVAALAAAQNDDMALCDAHLNWLMGGKNTADGRRAALRLVNRFSVAGLFIDSPPVTISAAPKKPNTPILHIVGNAQSLTRGIYSPNFQRKIGIMIIERGENRTLLSWLIGQEKVMGMWIAELTEQAAPDVEIVRALEIHHDWLRCRIYELAGQKT